MKKLKCLNLCLTEVEKLPNEPMPLLEEIHLIGSRNVTSSELTRFSIMKSQMPGAFWMERNTIARSEVRRSCPVPSGEVGGRQDVEKLIASIEVEENDRGRFYPYDGFTTYVFFHGNRKIGKLNLRTGVAWEFWPAEVPFTSESTHKIYSNGYAY